MNVFTTSNNANAAENKALDSIPGKRKQILADSIEAQEYKLRDQDWSVPSVKTSPLVCSQSNKVVQPKRKKRRTWTQAEDNVLIEQARKVSEPMHLRWPDVAATINSTFGSERTGKQCRERWLNNLRPDLKKGNWTAEEEMMINQLYATFGPKWSTMSKLIKNRTDNDIKNKWYSMKRTEEAARKAKKPRKKGSRKRARISKDQNVARLRPIPEQQKSAKMQPYGTEISSGWNYAFEQAILPTVTDGGSAENSPVSQVKYLSFEI